MKERRNLTDAQRAVLDEYAGKIAAAIEQIQKLQTERIAVLKYMRLDLGFPLDCDFDVSEDGAELVQV